ncbi:MAG TPA: FG-GAP-like repeat-containing protein [Thermoanaerobaculia bacterium]|nr:FG-GAP-like repeat-containing protein [Thermoanaerobaculia bacterium]
MIPLRSLLLVALAGAPLLAQTPPASTEKKPEPPRVTITRYTMTAGDVTGDGIAESIVYDTDSKAIRVISYNSGAAPFQTMGLFVDDVVSEMTAADLDGDGKAEIIAGHGLLGYNPKEGPQTDATVRIYKPATKGDWSPVEIYRKATERPDVTTIRATDLDGDGQKEIVFGYMASKYMTALRVAKRSGDTWTISELPTIRMAMHVDVGDVLHDGRKLLVVGRPYGDPPSPDTTTAIGDAFVLDGEKRIPLPVTRGVSAIAVGDVDGDGRDEIVVGDGWHSNYGKLARSRLAVISRQRGEWKYDLIEDLEGHIRFEQIDLVDLDGDGEVEIIARAGQSGAIGGSVRIYERAGNGWRGMTAARLAQTHAAGDFNGDKKLELVFTGQPPLPFSLAETAAPAWETKLGEAVETRDIDPKSLLDRRAPALQATEWIGSDPQTLRSLEGKVVLLDFWATWCKPCIEMYPEMREWVKEFGSDLVILGITNHSRQTSAQVRRFFNRQKLPWPVAVDPANKTHIDYGVSPIPHTFLIDRRGIVRLEHRGGGDLTVIKNKLRELMAEKPARASE